ncbi:MAG TPA: sulfatase-like hydrolase/transferase, partial [Thermoanaerobaculia bacterium]|nr:sulfatase-like hydrolase/transferase [Thermoanaerobaculia bacterium]
RDPAQDLPYIAGLYDTEIHYVDRFLPALFDGLDADALARTLFVFTADHGEELFDHGGWKHGRTLYEEQLRVPFIVRWDGHLPAGVRVAGPVRLLDVAPTLVAAAGGQLPPSWQGHDLAPLLAGGAPAERSPLFAEHLADGPRRAAVIARRWKLILFDRQAPFSPGNELEALSYRQELARLERVELYDLARDPGERRNLASQRPDVVARLAPLVHDQLGRERPGLRVLLAGVPEGGRLTVELRCRRLPSGWEPLFLAADDRVTAAGDRLQLELRGDPVAKGVLLPADTELLAVHTSGATPVRVRLGGGKLAGGTPTPAEMRHRGWPGGADDGPTLWLWLPPEGAPAVDARPDPETQRRLKALGYVG